MPPKTHAERQRDYRERQAAKLAVGDRAARLNVALTKIAEIVKDSTAPKGVEIREITLEALNG